MIESVNAAFGELFMRTSVHLTNPIVVPMYRKKN